MSKFKKLAVVGVVLVASACAHSFQNQSRIAEPLECSVIEEIASATKGPVHEIASSAPKDGEMLESYRGTVEDAGKKDQPVNLKSCSKLQTRLAPSGMEFSRVALNIDATRAVVEVDCGPWFLYRSKSGERWKTDAIYTSVHGCNAVP